MEWLNYRSKITTPISDELLKLIQSGVISETLITDWQHEGLPDGFEQKLLEEFPLKDVPMIVFGGISEHDQMRTLLQSTKVAAVAVGNFLLYREHAIQNLKEVLTGMPLRLPIYESEYSLMADV